MRLLHHDRIAAWADSRLLPAALTILLVTDLLVGLNWLFAPPAALTSPAYDTAKMIAPMQVWGVAFALCTTTAAGALAAAGRRWLTGYLVSALCGGLWAFWTVLFTLAPLGRPGASLLGALLALCLCLLHVLTGLAVTRRPGLSPPDGR